MTFLSEIKVQDKQPVNVTMLTYNRLEFTKKCLESFKRTVKYPHVLTIVDNNSTDGTKDWLRDNGHSFISMKENVGIAKGCNYSWHKGPKDYFVKLDNDIEFKKDGWLDDMVNVIDNAPFAGVVSYYCFDERRLGRKQPVTVRNVNGISLQDIDRFGDDAQGACLMIPRRTWEKLGYFCEEYNPYGQVDADYGWRVSSAGLRNCYMMDEECIVHLANDSVEKVKNPQYFEQKEAHRAGNIGVGGKGPFFQNAFAYKSGKKSLYHATMWEDKANHDRVVS